jgi:Family of unknown function (DUF5906)
MGHPMTVPTNNNDDPTTNAPDEGTSPDHALETARILDAVLMTERGKYWRKLAKEAIDEAEKEAQRLLDQGASRADAAKTDKQKRDALQHAEDAAARVRRSAAARAEGYEAKIRSMFDRALKDAEKIAREEARIQAMRQAEQDRKDRIARGELEDYEAALTCYVFNAKDCRYINRNTRETLKAEAVDRLHLSQMPAGARGGRPRPTEVYDSLPDTVVDRVKDMLYMPGKDFIVELRKGEETIKVANSYTPDRHPAAQGDISMLLQLVDHLCDGREFEKNYVMDWMAFVYQNHGVQLKQAILMHGKFGGGKDSLFEIMSAMLGTNGGSVKPHDLMGNRQTWVQSKEFVSVSEIAGAGLGDRDGYETLKQIITNPVLPIDPKFRDHVEARNSVNFMFGSNHNDAIRIEPGDRRFFVIHNKRPSLEETFGKEWVGAFAEWRKSEDGLAAIACCPRRSV